MKKQVNHEDTLEKRAANIMKKPVLVLVNGLPGSGKTTLAQRLGRDARLPVFSRDAIYETLVDALAGDAAALPDSLGSAAYRLMYHAAEAVLAGGKAAIIEGFFGRPELRTAELEELRQRHDFQLLQILCKADGALLLERFLARAGSKGRHGGHADLAWLEANRERLLGGKLEPLALGGRLIEFDTGAPDGAAYDALLREVQAALG